MAGLIAVGPQPPTIATAAIITVALELSFELEKIKRNA